MSRRRPASGGAARPLRTTTDRGATLPRMTRSVPSPKLLVTGGAVLVASAAYAIGTQASGGTAGAATQSARTAQLATVGATGTTGPGHAGFRGHGRGAFGPVLAEAATALGVSEEKLRTALMELRPSLRDRSDRRDELASALARALGVDAAKVAAALDAQFPERGDRGARFDALAKELGVTSAKVEAALRAVRPERRAQRGTQGGRDAFLAALAEELGVTEAKLTSALGRVGGPGGPGRHGPGGHHGPALDAAALAKALGVDAAEVTGALTAFRAAQRKEHDARFDALAKQLAEKLGVTEAKVQEVAERFLPGGGKGFGRP